ncbi:MAG: CobD/CbiB family cobalamin biosynthesis protein [Corynebacterium sp.]|nr:CobD/CbiB family cobalamin biosynthesis protein [Corynebacterium sp.]
MSIGIILGMAADRICGDPPTAIHPVALFGRTAHALEQTCYRDSKVAGVVFLSTAVIPPVAATYLLSRRYPTATLAFSLFCALGGTTLEKIGGRMATALDTHQLDDARELIPWLCSRDPNQLDEQGMIRATVESLAENTSDAAIAPLLWATCGAPGVVLHRLVNTLDAMVGYQSPRYRNFGWAAAKLDDALAYLPARFTALSHVGYATTCGRSRAAWRAWLFDAPSHPSPNAGPVEATAAGALGTTLGGTTIYAHGTENRPTLGNGPAPTTATIREAITLSRCTQVVAGLSAIAVTTLRGQRRKARKNQFS